MKDRLALISVSDKAGLVDFARGLTDLGFIIVSTGGTKKALSEVGIPVKSVSELTGFPEILDGRVKTLHPVVYGGILARRDVEEDTLQLERRNIGFIDLVVVNLYPFARTVARPEVTLAEAIENIDIGGLTLIRASAKNFKYVTVVVNPDSYPLVLEELRKNGSVSESTRFTLAVEAFSYTAKYDALISGWLYKALPEAPIFPDTLVLPFTKLQDLRYGENPQQRAAFYRELNPAEGSLARAKQLHGKELSFNNLNDLNAAWELVLEFEEPVAVIIKHANPCGVAVGDNIYNAYNQAFKADPVSAFGCIVGANRMVDTKTAEVMSQNFLEVIIAPGYEEEALQILKRKKDLRLLEAPVSNKKPLLDMKKVWGGLLAQEIDNEIINPASWKYVTRVIPDTETIDDLIFAMKVVKHVKSNAIVLAKNGQTLGIGAGQMNRVSSAKIAIEQAGEKSKGSVMASDAFFPFRDTVDEAAKAGVKAIIQPGGSLKDQESIDTCDEYGIAMVITGRRYFKH